MTVFSFTLALTVILADEPLRCGDLECSAVEAEFVIIVGALGFAGDYLMSGDIPEFGIIFLQCTQVFFVQVFCSGFQGDCRVRQVYFDVIVLENAVQLFLGCPEVLVDRLAVLSVDCVDKLFAISNCFIRCISVCFDIRIRQACYFVIAPFFLRLAVGFGHNFCTVDETYCQCLELILSIGSVDEFDGFL